MIEIPTETAFLSEWELTYSELTAGEPAQDQTGALNVGDSYMVGVVCVTTVKEARIYQYCLNWFLKPFLFGWIPC